MVRVRYCVRMQWCVWLGLLMAACKPIAPPPVALLHATTEAAGEDVTTAMIVIGGAAQLVFGGNGYGLALRVEHQSTEHNAFGLELTGGRGETGDNTRLWLFGVRGYGRYHLPTKYAAVTYGAGLSVLNLGLVTLTPHAGAAACAPNDYAAPYLHVGLGALLPLRRGGTWGREANIAWCPGCTEPGAPSTSGNLIPPPRADLFWYGELGMATRYGGNANQLSVSGAFAAAFHAVDDETPHMLVLSLADSQRFDP